MFDLGIAPSAFLLLAAPCVGSFIGLLADRLPRGRGVLTGRSSCESCHKRLSPLDLVPIVGFAINRGHCRGCGARVSALYPLLELASLGLAVWSLVLLPGWLAYSGALFAWLLLALAALSCALYIRM